MYRAFTWELKSIEKIIDPKIVKIAETTSFPKGRRHLQSGENDSF